MMKVYQDMNDVCCHGRISTCGEGGESAIRDISEEQPFTGEDAGGVSR